MSAILGIFHLDGRPATVDCVSPMLARMQRRGTEVRALHVEGEALLGVSRYEWECVPKLAGAAAVARRGHLTAVADASLYYVDDLVRRLGSAADGVDRDRPAELILAAYEKWGERCVEYLEGDYACIVWDAKERTGWCTRDWTGSRPLFYACRENTVVVASTIGGVLAHPVVRDELNLVSIAIDASALDLSVDHGTCLEDVAVVAAGGSLTWETRGRRVERRTWWHPVVREERSSSSLDDTAEELRALLSESVLQRMGPQSQTAVWLSGGHDSTAVFAAGEAALSMREVPDALRPFSLRLAADDPQNEDHFIEGTAARWQRQLTWLEVGELGEFLPLRGWDRRDEPYTHSFEQFSRRLSRMTQERGCRVALTGNGGDSLFFTSAVVLADLLAKGRLRELWRSWAAYGVTHARLRQFVHWAVAPLLPPRLHSAIGALRGRRLAGYLERPVPAWLRPEFVRAHGIQERAIAGAPPTGFGGRAAAEMHWYLTAPFFARINAIATELALEGGIEVRAPILDGRIVRLVASGPASERRKGLESKVLARRAMRGLLPREVLEPRPRKTGTMSTYFASSLTALAPQMQRTFGASRLEQLGIASGPALVEVAARHLPRAASGHVTEQLYCAFRTELWLAAGERVASAREQQTSEAIVALA